jgi:hypothetical protein
MTHQKSLFNGGLSFFHCDDYSNRILWVLYRQRQSVSPISEADFLTQVKALAYLNHWSCHHSQPSLTRRGQYITTGSAGFPDLVMAHEERGLIFAELKTSKGKASEAQLSWLRTLHPHAECYLWRPDDLTFIAQRLASK